MKRLRYALAALLVCVSVRAEPVRLVFVGDVMLDDGPGKVIASGQDPLAYFDAELRGADFTIGNLECAIATVGHPLEHKNYSFRADPRVIPLLQKRFGALSVANNHSGDYGQAAFLETLGLLDDAGIRYFGGGKDLAGAHAPLWIEREGLRIAVLGYNEFKPRAFEAGIERPGVAWSEDGQVITDIRVARAAGADLVIPFMHWGWEREVRPSDRQRELARMMIDAGADLVVGAHPHVTQGVDLYRGKLIVYSLGNFVFDGFQSDEAKRGWLLHLTLDRHGLVDWHTRVAQMDNEGTPHPVPGAMTPCGTMARGGHAPISGQSGDARLQMCVNP